MSLLVPDTGLLFWMTLSFGIVLFVLIKLGFPVITRAIENRRNYIEDAMKSAQTAEQKLASVNSEIKELMAQANTKRVNIIHEAEQLGSKLVEQAKDSAKQEAQQILANAAAEAEELKRKAVSQATSEIAVLSVRIAEKVLGESFSNEEQQKEYINRLLKKEAIHQS